MAPENQRAALNNRWGVPVFIAAILLRSRTTTVISFSQGSDVVFSLQKYIFQIFLFKMLHPWSKRRAFFANAKIKVADSIAVKIRTAKHYIQSYRHKLLYSLLAYYYWNYWFYATPMVILNFYKILKENFYKPLKEKYCCLEFFLAFGFSRKNKKLPILIFTSNAKFWEVCIHCLGLSRSYINHVDSWGVG